MEATPWSGKQSRDLWVDAAWVPVQVSRLPASTPSPWIFCRLLATLRWIADFAGSFAKKKLNKVNLFLCGFPVVWEKIRGEEEALSKEIEGGTAQIEEILGGRMRFTRRKISRKLKYCSNSSLKLISLVKTLIKSIKNIMLKLIIIEIISSYFYMHQFNAIQVK